MLDDDKRCGRCYTYKPLAEFGSNRSKSDRLADTCKECRKWLGEQYRKTHPEASWRSNYRAACRQANVPIGQVDDFTVADLTARWGDRCSRCESVEWTTVLHVQAVADGGDHTLQNCRPSCSRCARGWAWLRTEVRKGRVFKDRYQWAREDGEWAPISE